MHIYSTNTDSEHTVLKMQIEFTGPNQILEFIFI
jgi:hypothetical protein